MLNWQKEWPNEVGTYLFYGQRFKDDEYKLYIVYVRRARNSQNKQILAFVCNDNFMWKSETGDGYFANLNSIELPNGEN